MSSITTSGMPMINDNLTRLVEHTRLPIDKIIIANPDKFKNQCDTDAKFYGGFTRIFSSDREVIFVDRSRVKSLKSQLSKTGNYNRLQSSSHKIWF